MAERADSPHEAAVHLMKAIRCCKNCEQVNEADFIELSDLEQEKERLVMELSEIGNPDMELQRLRGEIHDLEYLVERVKEQNQIAYQCGLKQIGELLKERECYEKDNNQSYQYQYLVEKQKLKNLTIEIENQIQRIQYLHKINQQLVNKFCLY